MSEWTLNGSEFLVERGNLADQTTEAIALDVGTDWAPEGPASGAILAAGGDRLRTEIEGLDSSELGSVVSIESGDLPCDRIFLFTMTTEPELADPDEWLQNSYRNLLESVQQTGHSELALPPLGLGDFDWSIERTSTTAVETVREFAEQDNNLRQIKLVVYDAIEYSSVENFADEILGDKQAEPDAEQRLRDYY